MMALLFGACLALSACGVHLKTMGCMTPMCLDSIRVGNVIARASGLVALVLGLAMMRGAA